MFHPESNPLAPKSYGPKKPEKELVEIWLGKDAAAEMGDEKPETGDEEDLNPKKHELTEKEKKTLWEMKRPDEVALRNIPEWEKLPDEEAFKKDFKFDWIWEQEYRNYRFIEKFETQNRAETLPYAKVFDIADAIAKAQEKNPEHPGSLTTAEVLKVIDAAGYRPATFEELIAYGRDHWKPNVDPESLTKEERDILHSQAPFVFGLNSIFVDSNGRRCAPSLGWRGIGRDLRAFVLEINWSAARHFLVLRKSSP